MHGLMCVVINFYYKVNIRYRSWDTLNFACLRHFAFYLSRYYYIASYANCIGWALSAERWALSMTGWCRRRGDTHIISACIFVLVSQPPPQLRCACIVRTHITGEVFLLNQLVWGVVCARGWRRLIKAGRRLSSLPVAPSPGLSLSFAARSRFFTLTLCWPT